MICALTYELLLTKIKIKIIVDFETASSARRCS